jgi:hypothetical protein
MGDNSRVNTPQIDDNEDLPLSLYPGGPGCLRKKRLYFFREFLIIKVKG